MPFHRWLTPLLCAGILTASFGVSADSAWYEIELIVFARNAERAGNSEDWPQYPGLPDWSTAIPISSAEQEPDQAAATSTPTAITPLPKSRYRLSSEARNLSKTAGRLEPLLHLAWRQQVAGRERAQWVHLQSRDTASTGATGVDLAGTLPKLEGVVRVSLSRFLHVNLDLLLRQPALQGGYASLRSYRMQDHRRMRSGELHYIDHPLMGVLIQATPYEPPRPEPAPTPAPAADTPTNTPASAPVTPAPASPGTP